MHIDLYQDIVCPWCRIGKRHLELALAEWQGEPVTIAYRPFFLNADIPEAGYPFREYMQAKIGGRAPLEELFRGPEQAGAAVGVGFDFAAIQYAPNTTKAHLLVQLAAPADKPTLINALYAAYFSEGQDIGDAAVLSAIGSAHGLDPAQIATIFADPAAHERLVAEVAEAQALGINAVPFFVLNGRVGLSGAQPPATLIEALDYTRERFPSG